MKELKLVPEGKEAQHQLVRALNEWGMTPTARMDRHIRMHTHGGQVHFMVPLWLFSLYGPLPFTSKGKRIGWTRLLLSRKNTRVILESDLPCLGHTPPAH